MQATLSPASPSWQQWLQRFYYPLLLAGIIVNAAGLFTTIMEPDGALYATIAKTIALTNDFAALRVNGADWLDKPHFAFWMAALSFKLFGITSFAYKLPALLFWAMGAWYTFQLAAAFYDRNVARLAVLIYVSAAHLVVSNFDVRAEPYLTGLIAGSIFHFHKSAVLKSAGHLLAGALLAGCAVMTKGIFVCITIFPALLLHDWIVTSGRPRLLWWAAAILLTFFFTLPELYCLYLQFDLHPEKTVFGHTGVSGISFFFWDSQFGRFFNTGPIRGSGDPFFYLHTLLWAFLPWSLPLYAAMAWKLKHTRTGKGVNPEYILLTSIIITFLLFSFSRFQLPHYLNILFPFFAIVTAQCITRLQEGRAAKLFAIIQQSISLLLMALVLAICWLFHFNNTMLVALALLLPAACAVILFRGNAATAVTGKTFMAAIIVYGFLQFFFYPALLRYQAGSEAALFLQRTGRQQQVLQYHVDSYAFDFYHPFIPPKQDDSRFFAGLQKQPQVVLSTATALDSLKIRGYGVDSIRSFPNFHISQLTGPFIYYKSRPSTLESWQLATISAPKRQP